MADGTLRLTVDIEPRHAIEAFTLFGAPGNPCAIARLTNAAAIDQMQEPNSIDDSQVSPEKKGGELARLAGILCQSPDFIGWLGVDSAEEAKGAIYADCRIDSRKELDHDTEAASRFHRIYREPFVAYMKKRGESD